MARWRMAEAQFERGGIGGVTGRPTRVFVSNSTAQQERQQTPAFFAERALTLAPKRCQGVAPPRSKLQSTDLVFPVRGPI